MEHMQDFSISAKSRFALPRTIQPRWIVFFVVVILAIIGGFAYWRYRELHPVTDDAYASAGMLRVVAETSGSVTHVYVRNDERVVKDDPLFDVDPTLYEVTLNKARAQFEEALSAGDPAADTLKNDAIKLEEKGNALKRALKVYRGAKEVQGADQPPSAKLTSARKGWQDASKAFRDAEGKFENAAANLVATSRKTVTLLSAANQLAKAVYEWSHTHVTAPANGYVSSMTLQPGGMVRAGVPLFAIIKANQWWVNANYKEADLARMKVGQKATIRFDMYPGVIFSGRVEGISKASGATFSVLPPQNATGNWVKVPQRFPVQIRIINPGQHTNDPLRVGASATVTVDTLSTTTTSSEAAMAGHNNAQR
jgi:membrane fusion protein, multidrug efflux system